MKSYTDIEQSRKLTKVLSTESADMYYMNGTKHVMVIPNYETDFFHLQEKDIPAWSLAALLSALPNSIYDNTNEYSQLEFSKISVAYHDINDRIKVGSIKDNLIDACVETILKLHELNLL